MKPLHLSGFKAVMTLVAEAQKKSIFGVISHGSSSLSLSPLPPPPSNLGRAGI